MAYGVSFLEKKAGWPKAYLLWLYAVLYVIMLRAKVSVVRTASTSSRQYLDKP